MPVTTLPPPSSFRQRVAERWARTGPWPRILLTAFGIGGIAFGLAWYFCFFRGCPDVHRLAAHTAGGAPVLLDRNGKPFADLAPVEAELVRLADLPKHVPEAFIAIEDRRFREHGAVDLRRIVGALFENVRARGIEEGSSTITMQLARNVFPDRLPGQRRTIGRKLLEVRVAAEIEDEFTKDEILEMYLNHIYFGNGARGIEAAARHYFRKPAKALALHEAALLAALPKAPSHYDPRRHPKKAKERRDLVLAQMEEQGRVPKKDAEEARKKGLGVVSRPRAQRPEAPFAAYFAEEVRREVEEHVGDALYAERVRIHTTLDVNAQRAAEEELVRQLAAIEAGAAGAFRGPRYAAGVVPEGDDTPYLQGAVVVLEAATGDVLAWAGGRDYRHSRFDRVKGSRRQAGSAFKPFVYAAALQQGRTLGQPISDEPLRLTLARHRVWEPRNFDGMFEHRVTLRDALVRSKNVATVRLAQEVGVDRVKSLAESAGIEPPIPDEPSMALGTVSVSPLEIATAFTPFATLGTRATPRLVKRVEREDGTVLWEAPEPEGQKVLDDGIAYLVTDALREALVRGTGSAVSASGLRAPAAGKTGTTNDGADAWFVGYTADAVAAVWVGFDERRPIMPRATGGRLAAPVWARVMKRIYSARPMPGDWARPGGIIEALIDPSSGLALQPGCAPFQGVAYRELFLPGTAPQAVCPTQGPVVPVDLLAEMGGLDFEEGLETGLTAEDILREAEERDRAEAVAEAEAREDDEDEDEDERAADTGLRSYTPSSPAPPTTMPSPSPPAEKADPPAEAEPQPTPSPSPGGQVLH